LLPGAAIVTALLAAACSHASERPDPQTIVVGARTAPNNLDPRLANDEASTRVAQLVFTSLMDLGDDLRPRPKLAQHLDNPDPRTYVAHLRRGVHFHDGHELTARDVVYTYRSLVAPESVSPYKGAFQLLESVDADDAYTVRFRLTEPFAAFPVQLTTPPIVPDGAGAGLSQFPIGTGPYRFVRYDVDDRVVLTAFPEYYEGPPENPGLVLRIIPDDTMRGLALRTGDLDVVVNDLPPDIVHQLERDSRFRVERSPGLDFSYLAFNFTNPVLADWRVRHAIGYAIDRDAIVTYLRRGLAREATGLVPPIAWAYEPQVHQFTHDPERATRLLDEAGYPDPDGAGPLPRLRLSLKISTNEETRLQSTIVQQDLRRVGIELALESYEFATFFADVVKGNFQMFSLQFVGGALVDPDILRRAFHSTQVPPAGFNRGHYQNAEADRAIELASRAQTEDERRHYYGEAQRVVARDAPYIPIWNRTNVVIAQRALVGLRVAPTGDFQVFRDARREPSAAITP
jgi:peptide/nickel transport system substrate-binding protein